MQSILLSIAYALTCRNLCSIVQSPRRLCLCVCVLQILNIHLYMARSIVTGFISLLRLYALLAFCANINWLRLAFRGTIITYTFFIFFWDATTWEDWRWRPRWFLRSANLFVHIVVDGIVVVQMGSMISRRCIGWRIAADRVVEEAVGCCGKQIKEKNENDVIIFVCNIIRYNM